MKIMGNGSIEELIPNEKYSLRHYLGEKDPNTNKYKRSPRKIVYCTKREAKYELALYKQELLEQAEQEKHPELHIKMPTIEEYTKEYMDVRKETKTLSANTLQCDERNYRYVNELFGNFLMDELTPRIINKRLASYKRVNKCSLNKINVIAKALKTLYRRAMREGIIEYSKNPCFGIEIDKPEEPDRHSLTRNEYIRLQNIVDNYPLDYHIVAVKLGLSTGMRKGEVFGLTWKNVDFNTSQISVVQQYTEDKEFKTPKSRAGTRRLYIDSNTLEYLKQWKKLQSQLFIEEGMKQTGSSLVVCYNNGKPADPRNFNRWFRNFCVDNGFGRYTQVRDTWGMHGKSKGWHRKVRSGYEGLCFHELRHTQATLLIGSGCDIKTVQHRLGHADVETTLNTYSHMIDANDIAAANIIAGLS